MPRQSRRVPLMSTRIEGKSLKPLRAARVTMLHIVTDRHQANGECHRRRRVRCRCPVKRPFVYRLRARTGRVVHHVQFQSGPCGKEAGLGIEPSDTVEDSVQRVCSPQGAPAPETGRSDHKARNSRQHPGSCAAADFMAIEHACRAVDPGSVGISASCEGDSWPLKPLCRTTCAVQGSLIQQVRSLPRKRSSRPGSNLSGCQQQRALDILELQFPGIGSVQRHQPDAILIDE